MISSQISEDFPGSNGKTFLVVMDASTNLDSRVLTELLSTAIVNKELVAYMYSKVCLQKE